LKTKDKTILMCSHRLDDVQDVCDRIAILFNGDLQELGKVDRLVEDQKRLEVRATDLEMTDALKDDLAKLFAKHGGKLESFATRRRRSKTCSCDRAGVEGPPRPPVPAAGRGVTEYPLSLDGGGRVG